MAQTGENAPLSITNKAMKRLAVVKVDQNVVSGRRLRVRSRANEKLGILGFDMYFDKDESDNDMVYNVKGIELILDLATAYYLIGSTLDVDRQGEFMFKHMDLNEQTFEIDEIQYN